MPDEYLPDAPPRVEDVLDAAADVLETATAFVTILRRWSRRPASLHILVNGSTGMPTHTANDKPVSVHVIYDDRYNRETGEPAPTALTVSDTTLASIGPHPAHPNDDTWAQVISVSGSGTFTVSAKSGTLSGTSDDIVWDPGTATTAHVDINMS